jgi:hypothetical protein
MVKIIKEGKIPAQSVYGCACRNCRTEFTFEDREAELIYDPRDGDYLQIDCPLCKMLCTRNVVR